MKNLTLAIPDDLKARMDARPEINWSAAVRVVLQKTIDDFDRLEAVLSKSRFTQADADGLAATMDAGMAAHARKLLNAPRG
ncbi:hypothetical protein AUJ14_05690 [Candidatus Micrarchaeota archaeon CG1_02_55_22]|nr:MAG: hypothetical protein AUJ14_05690 [Candidatus Micrarchaeota archaeon CG1_02_55_22]